ncbi:MAG: phosphatase PAP2 family protein [Marmoricola sp.]
MRPSTGLAIIGAILAVVSGFEVLTHGPLFRTDITVALHFANVTPTWSTSFASFLNKVGKPGLACFIVGTLGLIVTVLRHRIEPVLMVAIGLGVAGVSTWVLKSLFPRISIFNHQNGSFPSGHTAVAVVASGLVVYLLLPSREWRAPVALVIAALWGVVMAWGRVVIDVHWLSDVIAGWGIGIVALVLALRTADSPPGIPRWVRPAPADR